MEFVAQMWRFLRARKKFWLLPIIVMMVAARRADRARAGLGRRAVHLHAVLSAMRILGISAYYHDSAAALLVRRRDRRRRAGRALHAQEARRGLSARRDRATAWRAPASRAADIDHVAFYDKPFLKFERLLETYLAFAPRGFASFRKAMPVWLKEKLFQKDHARQGAASEIDGTHATGTSGCCSPSTT